MSNEKEMFGNVYWISVEDEESKLLKPLGLTLVEPEIVFLEESDPFSFKSGARGTTSGRVKFNYRDKAIIKMEQVKTKRLKKKYFKKSLSYRILHHKR